MNPASRIPQTSQFGQSIHDFSWYGYGLVSRKKEFRKNPFKSSIAIRVRTDFQGIALAKITGAQQRSLHYRGAGKASKDEAIVRLDATA
jgi:hypothetical protein